MVVAESNGAEDKSEDDSHETNIDELGEFETDSFENVADLGVVAKNIHDVDEVKRRVEECSHKGNYHIYCYSPKLST